MDEVWRNLPGEREPSVHLTLFPQPIEQWEDDDLLGRWDQLRAIRDEVNLQIEDARQRKAITSNLSAHVDLEAPPEVAGVLAPYRDFLPTLFGVSTAVLREAPPGSEMGVALVKVEVTRASGVKCERCWRFVPLLSEEQDFKGLCERCVDALAEPPVGSAS
jgi:isoleucyl-tRNA synthetase